MRLIMTEGLPASGKSTWAKKEVEKSNGKVKRVNKDDLRAMIDASKWSKDNEKHILKISDKVIEHYMSNGFDVIVDDTNLHPKHQKALQEIAEGFRATFEVKSFLDVPLKTCITRDIKRDNSVGEKIIRGMYNQFIKPAPEEYEPSPDKPNCIIVDVDGTLAHMSGRSPYDYTKVSTDVVDRAVSDLVNFIYDCQNEFDPTYIIIVTGREGTKQCFEDTQQWLHDNHIPFHEYYQRAEGDDRNDAIVKKEIYENNIKDRYNVRFVLDDRDRVVEMWRGLGLKVFQVAEGDF